MATNLSFTWTNLQSHITFSIDGHIFKQFPYISCTWTHLQKLFSHFLYITTFTKSCPTFSLHDHLKKKKIVFLHFLCMHTFTNVHLHLLSIDTFINCLPTFPIHGHIFLNTCYTLTQLKIILSHILYM